MIFKDKPLYMLLFPTGVIAVVDADEMQRLDGDNTRFDTLGVVCDNEEFGDCCSTDCVLYAHGTCPMETIRDSWGSLWHVLRHEVHHNY